MKIDLHIHSTASDGTWTPQELVEAAKNAELKVIAVTDHDSVANVVQVQKLAETQGITCLSGVEICATKDNFCYHILGYGIDIENRALLKLLHHNEELLDQKDEDSIKNLIDRNWKLNLQEFTDYRYDRRRGGWKSLAFLQDQGLCGDVHDFFARIFTKENDLGFPSFPSIKEVIETIHAAGGVALLAHAASSFHGPGLESVLLDLKDEKFDGFECYHSGHSAEDTKTMLEYCKENNFLISGEIGRAHV